MLGGGKKKAAEAMTESESESESDLDSGGEESSGASGSSGTEWSGRKSEPPLNDNRTEVRKGETK